MLAHRAASWISDPKMPAAVRSGGQEFLTRMQHESFPLFSGAETPKGITSALSGIFARLRGGAAGMPGDGATAARQYADFWNHILMGPPDKDGQPEVSESLYAGLAETMFRTWETATNRAADAERQRSDFADLISWWREDLEKNPEPPSSAIHPFQNSFGDPLARLLRGDGRGPGAPYLWQPADELDARAHDLGGLLDGSDPLSAAVNAKIEQARLTQAPEQFLDLTKWFFSLRQPTDPPALLALFDTPDQAVEATNAPRPQTRTP
jgi:hypothetical protein